MKRLLLLLTIAFFVHVSAFAEENTCVSCHKALTDVYQKKMFMKWDNSPHQKAGIYCNDCHDGDPSLSDKDASHHDANFGNPDLERTSPRNVSETCGNCHLSVFDEFRQSKHYQNLAKDEFAPNCGNCHYNQEGRTIDHSQLSDFCTNCHKMTAQETGFFITFDAARVKELSDETKKSLATAERMVKFQATLKTKTVSEKNLKLAKKLMTIAEVNLHNSATSWHQFKAGAIPRYSEKAYFLAQAAIDLLLPQKK